MHSEYLHLLQSHDRCQSPLRDLLLSTRCLPIYEWTNRNQRCECFILRFRTHRSAVQNDIFECLVHRWGTILIIEGIVFDSGLGLIAMEHFLIENGSSWKSRKRRVFNNKQFRFILANTLTAEIWPSVSVHITICKFEMWFRKKQNAKNTMNDDTIWHVVDWNVNSVDRN